MASPGGRLDSRLPGRMERARVPRARLSSVRPTRQPLDEAFTIIRTPLADGRDRFHRASSTVSRTASSIRRCDANGRTAVDGGIDAAAHAVDHAPTSTRGTCGGATTATVRRASASSRPGSMQRLPHLAAGGERAGHMRGVHPARAVAPAARWAATAGDLSSRRVALPGDRRPAPERSRMWDADHVQLVLDPTHTRHDQCGSPPCLRLSTPDIKAQEIVKSRPITNRGCSRPRRRSRYGADDAHVSPGDGRAAWELRVSRQ